MYTPLEWQLILTIYIYSFIIYFMLWSIICEIMTYILGLCMTVDTIQTRYAEEAKYIYAMFYARSHDIASGMCPVV